ncbi:MAG TPA: lysine--tRNA ligase [Geminicoccus sp.]|jgi:lysyl-tRNA synthetase class 1|uniref:lysine--tRNA ligase n=1 Tax=Geminicoccus sp. TaxID=2024832 RepID=UPI002E32A90A|nr:lysine--tRNA ligase [Geminicoccus sp.]HEX2527308.1 lysine--tRNA ligase [Geminicoccus sp.]
MQELYQSAKAWPFVEARRLVERIAKRPPAKGFVLFETGYGPSGLPHIGTFAEVFRTTLIRNAFKLLRPDVPTELYAFSDDMDGLRKVPDNVPNGDMVREYLGKPLTAIPDPFGTHESFGHHMNARLRAFLDRFGFAYSFQSATDHYRAGRFDQALLRALEVHDQLVKIVTPILGAERAATYSPFLPISPKTGKVLQVRIEELKPQDGTVVFRDEDGTLTEVPVTGGHCKLQWRADWAMRWYALDVDYEMSGKDLIDSVKLGSQICRALGGLPPENLTYELFLDEQGQKISKSKGNGLTIDEWLRYATPESLQLFLYRDPKAAKRLYFDVIPKHVDEYQQLLEAYPGQDDKEKLGNPVWHIHAGDPMVTKLPLSFAMLLNLASVVNAEEPQVIWGYISQYAPGTTAASAPQLAKLVEHAVAYHQDFVKPQKKYRQPTEQERAALQELHDVLASMPEGAEGETIQNEVYAIGKKHGFEPLRTWFTALYEVLLGQAQGPRFGNFAALYGVGATRSLISQSLAGLPRG